LRLSVVVTSYNQQHYLEEALGSLLAQTVRPDEILVCDDYSTRDHSRDLIRGYAARYSGLVKPILHEQNLGIAANRNSGFRAATGELVTWLDGDDRFLPTKIERELDVLEGNSADIVYSNVFITDAHLRRLRTRYHPAQHAEGDLFVAIATRQLPPPMRMLLQRRCFEDVGFLDEGLTIYEDWEWKIRLANRFRFTYCPFPLYEYRQHTAGVHNLDIREHLGTMEVILQRALIWCDERTTADKLSERLEIEAFLAYIRGKQAVLEGDPTSALALLEGLPSPHRRVYTARLRKWIGRRQGQAARQALGRSEILSAVAHFTRCVRYDPSYLNPRRLVRALFRGEDTSGGAPATNRSSKDSANQI
jgi:glycosyltransferase involved in cell wall biosynthesis